MKKEPTLPATSVPASPYQGPSRRDPGFLKLDGNEGSLPDRDLLAAVAREDLSILRDYPYAGELESEIAESLGVDPAQVVVTAGADDGLDRVFRSFLGPGREVILPVPTFEMMYRFAEAAGGGIRTVPWLGVFPVEGIKEALDSNVSLVSLVSPNNPTGLTVTADELERVAEAAASAVVLLDHVYVDYADQDLTPLAAGMGNVVTVRTFSKAWGLAGCRVGFAVASPELAAILRNVGNPYPVSALSVVVARRRLKEGGDLMREHVRKIRENRRRLSGFLVEVGVDPSSSEGNFLFADFGEKASLVQTGLESLGIRVRRFRNRPEIATGLRISVPEKDEDLDRLEAGLGTVLDPEALLFDMDGVLADVTESYRRCVLETVESFGGGVSWGALEEAVQAGDANNDWVLTQRILASQGIAAPLEEVTARFQERYLGRPGHPGLRESETLLPRPALLKRLARRMPLGIVTGRPREEATWFLQRLGIGGLFETVVCMEDAPLKPDPEPVRLALARLRLRRAWFVGDTPDDIRAGALAGVLPLGIVAPGDDRDSTMTALESAGAAAVLPDLTLLEELLP